MMYNIVNLQNSQVGANNISGNAPSGSSNSGVGTGSEQKIRYQWIINPAGNYSCP